MTNRRIPPTEPNAVALRRAAAELRDSHAQLVFEELKYARRQGDAKRARIIQDRAIELSFVIEWLEYRADMATLDDAAVAP